MLPFENDYNRAFTIPATQQHNETASPSQTRNFKIETTPNSIKVPSFPTGFVAEAALNSLSSRMDNLNVSKTNTPILPFESRTSPHMPQSYSIDKAELSAAIDHKFSRILNLDANGQPYTSPYTTSFIATPSVQAQSAVPTPSPHTMSKQEIRRAVNIRPNAPRQSIHGEDSRMANAQYERTRRVNEKIHLVKKEKQTQSISIMLNSTTKLPTSRKFQAERMLEDLSTQMGKLDVESDSKPKNTINNRKLRIKIKYSDMDQNLAAESRRKVDKGKISKSYPSHRSPFRRSISRDSVSPGPGNKEKRVRSSTPLAEHDKPVRLHGEVYREVLKTIDEEDSMKPEILVGGGTFARMKMAGGSLAEYHPDRFLEDGRKSEILAGDGTFPRMRMTEGSLAGYYLDRLLKDRMEIDG